MRIKERVGSVVVPDFIAPITKILFVVVILPFGVSELAGTQTPPSENEPPLLALGTMRSRTDAVLTFIVLCGHRAVRQQSVITQTDSLTSGERLSS